MTPRRTMSIAQQLYEGRELGEYGLTGLITYMRTDSLRLADEATAARGLHSRPLRRGILSGQAAGSRPRPGRRTRTRPSVPPTWSFTPEEIRKSDLTGEQFKLYRLIWSRFLACQMANAVYDSVAVEIACGRACIPRSRSAR